jgi:nicotinate-nucleotide adenylyltransferase
MAYSLTVLVGGTFNPIHLGHTYIASKAYDALTAKACWLMPCRPIHRHAATVLAPEHRLAMVALAIRSFPYMQIERYELNQPEPSITLETLKYFKQHDPKRCFAYVMGQDVMMDLQSWDDWQQLLAYTHLVVVNRVLSKMPQVSLLEAVPRCWHKLCVYDAAALSKATCGKILLLELPPLSISATMVRSAFHQGAMIDPKWLDPQVYAYIQQHRLYLT